MQLFRNLKTQHRMPDASAKVAELADQSLEVAIRSKDVEAWETDPWVVKALMSAELLPRRIIDPCVGKGAWSQALTHAGHILLTVDLVDWSKYFPAAPSPLYLADWLTISADRLYWPLSGEDFAVVMNPPFSGDDGMLACHFVQRALDLGARKVVCFQRFSWMESDKRRSFWAENPPARVWLCFDRATCWRFDVPETCNGTCELDDAGKKALRTDGAVVGCRTCLSTTPTTHAVFVWERGHGGAAQILRLDKKE